MTKLIGIISSIAIAAVLGLSFPIDTSNVQNPARNPAVSDMLRNLDGIWETNDGEEVELHYAGDFVLQTGSVFTKFTANNTPPNGGCQFGGNRPKFIDGQVAGKKITGTMWRCTQSEPLVKDCHLQSVYTTTFRANIISADEIAGYRRTEYYGPASGGQCKFTRDPSGDRDVAFTLMRKNVPNSGNEDKPPDAICKPEEKKADPGDEQAAEFIKKQFKDALDKAKETAREMQDHGATVPQQISDQIKNLKKAADFWGQIKAGSCVPPDVLDTMRQVANDRSVEGHSENCFAMCNALRKWFEKLIGESKSVQGKVFMDDCLARCN